MSASFFSGIINGFNIFPDLKKRQEKSFMKFIKIKMNINRGFDVDKENLTKDWQNIYSDFDKSLKKLQQLV